MLTTVNRVLLKGFANVILLTAAFSMLLSCASAKSQDTIETPQGEMLLVTQFAGRHLSLVNPKKGQVAKIEVGRAPFGVVVTQDDTALVTTHDGVAKVDLVTRKRLSLTPYASKLSGPAWGEYRSGGMGIALSSDEQYLAVGINTSHASGTVEIYETNTMSLLIKAQVGGRPFQVLFGPGDKAVYSIDHDSYSVTQVELNNAKVETYQITPQGWGAFDKPHYAVFDDDGVLWLPVQGKSLVGLNVENGKMQELALTANTHQHGLAWKSETNTLYIVGTGPAGGAREKPSLSIVNLNDQTETILLLEKQHEQILLSENGDYAYLSGGHSYTGGWDGLTILDLTNFDVVEIEVEDQPLGLTLWNTGVEA